MSDSIIDKFRASSVAVIGGSLFGSEAGIAYIVFGVIPVSEFEVKDVD